MQLTTTHWPPPLLLAKAGAKMPVDHPHHLEPDAAPVAHWRTLSAALGFLVTLCCLWLLNSVVNFGTLMS